MADFFSKLLGGVKKITLLGFDTEWHFSFLSHSHRSCKLKNTNLRTLFQVLTFNVFDNIIYCVLNLKAFEVQELALGAKHFS